MRPWAPCGLTLALILWPRRQRVQRRHVVVEPSGLTEREIEVVHASQPGGADDVIVDVGDVAYIAHLVASIDQPALQHVVGDIGRGVPEVGGVVGRDAADVHRHALAGRIDGEEGHLASR